MESQTNIHLRPTRLNKKLSDPGEKDRLLMHYGGIFKNNISEFAEKFAKVNKPRKNYSK